MQDRLFTVGSSLACDPDKEPSLKIPDLKEEDIAYLESLMDKMNEVLEPMKSFILPGGHQAISTAHIARCVCRRAERWCVNLQELPLPKRDLNDGPVCGTFDVQQKATESRATKGDCYENIR